MRTLLALVLVVALSACAAAPDEPPLRFRRGGFLVLEADELAPVAGVDTALFVQVELRPLETTDAALTSIGVTLPEPAVLAAVVLDQAQVAAMVADFQEVQHRGGSPVITLQDQQHVRFGAASEAVVDLVPRVLEGRRELEVEVRRSEESLRMTAPDGAVMLLRHGSPGDPRWTLLVLRVISLREEDARRYTVEGD